MTVRPADRVICAGPAFATGRVANVLVQAASPVFADDRPVLVFVTTTLYVGQFADVGLTAPVPLVQAPVLFVPFGGRMNVGFGRAVVDDRLVVRPPVCVHVRCSRAGWCHRGS